MTEDVDLATALRLHARREAVCKHPPVCPVCSSEQVQIIETEVPARWKCRRCQLAFAHEPGMTEDVAGLQIMRYAASRQDLVPNPFRSIGGMVVTPIYAVHAHDLDAAADTITAQAARIALLERELSRRGDQ